MKLRTAILLTLPLSLCIPAVTQAGTLNILHPFATSDAEPGCQPLSTLVETAPGVFYGTTSNCGPSLFKITSTGEYTSLKLLPYYSSVPWGHLVHASNGMLYGVTEGGDIFESDLLGNITTLKTAGVELLYPLIEGSDGNLYGVEYDATTFTGTAFRMTLAGVISTIHTFSTTAEGTPQTQLTEASDGNFYGVSSFGVYRLSPAGTLTVLQSFPVDHRFAPEAMVEAPNGKLYGGLNGYPNAIFSINLDGTSFKFEHAVAPKGSEALASGLALASDGAIYGATRLFSYLFRYTTTGTLTPLTPFGPRYDDPFTPSAAVVQGSDGLLYGTLAGEDSAQGAIYTYDNALPLPAPFIQAVSSGESETPLTMLVRGRHLLGTTSVTVDGAPAAFTVTSDSFLSVTVPQRIHADEITVATRNGTVSHNLGQ